MPYFDDDPELAESDQPKYRSKISSKPNDLSKVSYEAEPVSSRSRSDGKKCFLLGNEIISMDSIEPDHGKQDRRNHSGSKRSKCRRSKPVDHDNEEVVAKYIRKRSQSLYEDRELPCPELTATGSQTTRSGPRNQSIFDRVKDEGFRAGGPINARRLSQEADAWARLYNQLPQSKDNVNQKNVGFDNQGDNSSQGKGAYQDVKCSKSGRRKAAKGKNKKKRSQSEPPKSHEKLEDTVSDAPALTNYNEGDKKRSVKDSKHPKKLNNSKQEYDPTGINGVKPTLMANEIADPNELTSGKPNQDENSEKSSSSACNLNTPKACTERSRPRDKSVPCRVTVFRRVCRRRGRSAPGSMIGNIAQNIGKGLFGIADRNHCFCRRFPCMRGLFVPDIGYGREWILGQPDEEGEKDDQGQPVPGGSNFKTKKAADLSDDDTSKIVSLADEYPARFDVKGTQTSVIKLNKGECEVPSCFDESTGLCELGQLDSWKVCSVKTHIESPREMVTLNVQECREFVSNQGRRVKRVQSAESCNSESQDKHKWRMRIVKDHSPAETDDSMRIQDNAVDKEEGLDRGGFKQEERRDERKDTMLEHSDVERMTEQSESNEHVPVRYLRKDDGFKNIDVIHSDDNRDYDERETERLQHYPDRRRQRNVEAARSTSRTSDSSYCSDGPRVKGTIENVNDVSSTERCDGRELRRAEYERRFDKRKVSINHAITDCSETDDDRFERNNITWSNLKSPYKLNTDHETMEYPGTNTKVPTHRRRGREQMDLPAHLEKEQNGRVDICAPSRFDSRGRSKEEHRHPEKRCRSPNQESTRGYRERAITYSDVSQYSGKRCSSQKARNDHFEGDNRPVESEEDLSCDSMHMYKKHYYTNRHVMPNHNINGDQTQQMISRRLNNSPEDELVEFDSGARTRANRDLKGRVTFRSRGNYEHTGSRTTSVAVQNGSVHMAMSPKDFETNGEDCMDRRAAAEERCRYDERRGHRSLENRSRNCQGSSIDLDHTEVSLSERLNGSGCCSRYRSSPLIRSRRHVGEYGECSLSRDNVLGTDSQSFNNHSSAVNTTEPNALFRYSSSAAMKSVVCESTHEFGQCDIFSEIVTPEQPEHIPEEKVILRNKSQNHNANVSDIDTLVCGNYDFKNTFCRDMDSESNKFSPCVKHPPSNDTGNEDLTEITRMLCRNQNSSNDFSEYVFNDVSAYTAGHEKCDTIKMMELVNPSKNIECGKKNLMSALSIDNDDSILGKVKSVPSFTPLRCESISTVEQIRKNSINALLYAASMANSDKLLLHDTQLTHSEKSIAESENISKNIFTKHLSGESTNNQPNLKFIDNVREYNDNYGISKSIQGLTVDDERLQRRHNPSSNVDTGSLLDDSSEEVDVQSQRTLTSNESEELLSEPVMKINEWDIVNQGNSNPCVGKHIVNKQSVLPNNENIIDYFCNNLKDSIEDGTITPSDTVTIFVIKGKDPESTENVHQTKNQLKKDVCFSSETDCFAPHENSSFYTKLLEESPQHYTTDSASDMNKFSSRESGGTMQTEGDFLSFDSDYEQGLYLDDTDIPPLDKMRTFGTIELSPKPLHSPERIAVQNCYSQSPHQFSFTNDSETNETGFAAYAPSAGGDSVRPQIMVDNEKSQDPKDQDQPITNETITHNPFKWLQNNIVFGLSHSEVPNLPLKDHKENSRKSETMKHSADSGAFSLNEESDSCLSQECVKKDTSTQTNQQQDQSICAINKGPCDSTYKGALARTISDEQSEISKQLSVSSFRHVEFTNRSHTLKTDFSDVIRRQDVQNVIEDCVSKVLSLTEDHKAQNIARPKLEYNKRPFGVSPSYPCPCDNCYHNSHSVKSHNSEAHSLHSDLSKHEYSNLSNDTLNLRSFAKAPKSWISDIPVHDQHSFDLFPPLSKSENMKNSYLQFCGRNLYSVDESYHMRIVPLSTPLVTKMECVSSQPSAQQGHLHMLERCVHAQSELTLNNSPPSNSSTITTSNWLNTSALVESKPDHHRCALGTRDKNTSALPYCPRTCCRDACIVSEIAMWNKNGSANNGDEEDSSASGDSNAVVTPDWAVHRYNMSVNNTCSCNTSAAGRSFKTSWHQCYSSTCMLHDPGDDDDARGTVSEGCSRPPKNESGSHAKQYFLSRGMAPFACRNTNSSGNMISVDISRPRLERKLFHVFRGREEGENSEDDYISAPEDFTQSISGDHLMRTCLSSRTCGSRVERDDTCNHPENLHYYMGDGEHRPMMETPKEDILMSISPCYGPESDPGYSYKYHRLCNEKEYSRHTMDAQLGQLENKLQPRIDLRKPIYGQGDNKAKRCYTQWYTDNANPGPFNQSNASSVNRNQSTNRCPTNPVDVSNMFQKINGLSKSSRHNHEGNTHIYQNTMPRHDHDNRDRRDTIKVEERNDADGDKEETDDDDDDDERDEDENEEDDSEVDDKEEENEIRNEVGEEEIEDEDKDGSWVDEDQVSPTLELVRDPTLDLAHGLHYLQNGAEHFQERGQRDNLVERELKRDSRNINICKPQVGRANNGPFASRRHNGYAHKHERAHAGTRPRLRQQPVNNYHVLRHHQGNRTQHSKPVSTAAKRKLSFDQIKVPSIQKDRVRFACDQNGEWAEIGRGSYGCVYLGLLDSTVEVAIKDFYESSSWDLVIHEARMLLFLQSTGVTPDFYGLRRRFDETKEPTEYCIIMEYFGDGRTLFNVMSDKTRLSREEWMDVVGQLVAGLRLIHRKNVLINDLKADNILIDLSSDRKLIRYIDVGMATYKHGLTFQLPKDQMNKYNFLAPEVREGALTSSKSDIYSLGYMLEQICRVAGGGLGGLDKLVSRCMDKNPGKRPSIDMIVSKVHQFISTKAHMPTIKHREDVLMTNSI